jgi:hypothetical protein
MSLAAPLDAWAASLCIGPNRGTLAMLLCAAGSLESDNYTENSCSTASSVKFKRKPFFIMSTGRRGSRSTVTLVSIGPTYSEHLAGKGD